MEGYKINYSEHDRFDTETEKDLLSRRNEPEARKKLIESYLKYIAYIASKYTDKGLPLDDLISEGTLGLIHALDKYDAEKGASFMTYASFWVRQYIQRALSRNHEIRLPYTAIYGYAAIKKCAEELEEAGEAIDIDKIARLTKQRKETVKQVLNPPTAISIQTELGNDFTLEELLAYTPNHISHMNEKTVKAANVALSYLNEEEQYVLKSRFGLDGFPPKSYREIGEELGCSHTTATFIFSEAIRKLRHPDTLDAIRREL